jgi:DNA polymerase-3 subunit beta
MAIVARDDQQRVQLCLKGDVLEMRCQSTIIGEAEERTFALGEGEELIIALHGRYLAEGIAALEEEGCYLEFTTSLSPCVVRPLTGDSYLYVQSPMHLR